MTKCEGCRNDYPGQLVSPIHLSAHGETETPTLCGVCALLVRNGFHGVPAQTPFTGDQAGMIFAATCAYAIKNFSKTDTEFVAGVLVLVKLGALGEITMKEANDLRDGYGI